MVNYGWVGGCVAEITGVWPGLSEIARICPGLTDSQNLAWINRLPVSGLDDQRLPGSGLAYQR